LSAGGSLGVPAFSPVLGDDWLACEAAVSSLYFSAARQPVSVASDEAVYFSRRRRLFPPGAFRHFAGRRKQRGRPLPARGRQTPSPASAPNRAAEKSRGVAGHVVRRFPRARSARTARPDSCRVWLGGVYPTGENPAAVSVVLSASPGRRIAAQLFLLAGGARRTRPPHTSDWTGGRADHFPTAREDEDPSRDDTTSRCAEPSRRTVALRAHEGFANTADRVRELPSCDPRMLCSRDDCSERTSLFAVIGDAASSLATTQATARSTIVVVSADEVGSAFVRSFAVLLRRLTAKGRGFTQICRYRVTARGRESRDISLAYSCLRIVMQRNFFTSATDVPHGIYRPHTPTPDRRGLSAGRERMEKKRGRKRFHRAGSSSIQKAGGCGLERTPRSAFT